MTDLDELGLGDAREDASDEHLGRLLGLPLGLGGMADLQPRSVPIRDMSSRLVRRDELTTSRGCSGRGVSTTVTSVSALTLLGEAEPSTAFSGIPAQ
jgi:hypothetical protein